MFGILFIGSFIESIPTFKIPAVLLTLVIIPLAGLSHVALIPTTAVPTFATIFVTSAPTETAVFTVVPTKDVAELLTSS